MAAWVDQTIAEFGRSVGLDGLALGDAGVVSLELESTGSLFIEEAGDGVLIYLARTIPLPHDGMAERLLALGHYDSGLSVAVNPGLRGEDVFVLSARVPQAEFSLPALEQTIAALMDCYRRVDV